MSKDNWDAAFHQERAWFAPILAYYPTHWHSLSFWPTLADYNQHIREFDPPILSASGKPIQFVAQAKAEDFSEYYEPRIYLQGEVQTRTENWHDFFNMLAWCTFPHTKAVLNHYQYKAQKQRWSEQKQRLTIENVLAHFDENGAIIVCSDPNLTQLLKEQRWKELFWQQRSYLRTQMAFFIFGHGLNEKLLNPYIGVTAKSIVINSTQAFLNYRLQDQIQQIDQEVAKLFANETWLKEQHKLTPLPLLGIPNWWEENTESKFYDNADYFRPKHHTQ